MSFLLLFLLDLVYLWIYVDRQATVKAELARAGLPAESLQKISASLDGGLFLMLALTVVALIWNLLQIAYIRHLILRPVRLITAIFDETARGEGDFSRNLPVMSHDELRTLAESYNRFADKMREIIGEVRKASVNIAREAVAMRRTVSTTTQRSAKQGEIARDVFAASNEATQAIMEVSRSTETISHSTELNLTTARDSLNEMNTIVDKVGTVSDKLGQFNDTVGSLAQRSESIRQIAALIGEIADQTNLLALNAAIEAARAGEMGRGFSVVADEVRKLAERVNVATKEIRDNIAGMTQLVRETQSENEVINRDIKDTRAVVERSSGEFSRMVGDFEQTGDQLTQIAAAMEELTATNGQVNTSVGDVHTLSVEVSNSMRETDISTQTLTQSTERVQEMVSRFRIGRGAFEFNVDRAREFRDAVQRKLEELADQGVNIWDQNYRPLAGTRPQKYEVSYLPAFERDMQPLLEAALSSLRGGAFALIIDTKGYGAIHNLKVSRPLTGDYDTDLAGNRTRRIWDDPTGQRGAKNQLPLLVQTYARDTGEILSEINMPIMVGGRHWGSVRAGCNSNVLLED